MFKLRQIRYSDPEIDLRKVEILFSLGHFHFHLRVFDWFQKLRLTSFYQWMLSQLLVLYYEMCSWVVETSLLLAYLLVIKLGFNGVFNPH